MGAIFDLRAKNSIYGRTIEYKGAIIILRANLRFPVKIDTKSTLPAMPFPQILTKSPNPRIRMTIIINTI